MVMSQAIITEGNDNCLRIDSDYNEEFITCFKNTIPWKKRSWNKQEKCWFVDKFFKPIVLSLLEEHYDYVDIQISEDVKIKDLEEEIRRLKRKSGSHADYDYNFMGLLPTAEDEVVKVAYKKLTLMNHPDRDGSERYMKDLNIVYNNIKTKRKI